MQTATQDGFKAIEERINSLETKINTHSRVESRGIKWKLNGIDATELCEKKKNCSPSWFVGKKRSGIVLLIDTFLLSVLTTEA